MKRIFALLLLVAACSKSQPATTPSAAARTPALLPLAGREWNLVSLGDRVAPTGNGGKPVTIRFDAGSATAAGSAGCNRFSARYRLAGDSVTFAPAVATKMACSEGMDLERAFLDFLSTPSHYATTSTTLTLRNGAGAVATFKPAMR